MNLTLATRVQIRSQAASSIVFPNQVHWEYYSMIDGIKQLGRGDSARVEAALPEGKIAQGRI